MKQANLSQNYFLHLIVINIADINVELIFLETHSNASV